MQRSIFSSRLPLLRSTVLPCSSFRSISSSTRSSLSSSTSATTSTTKSTTEASQTPIASGSATSTLGEEGAAIESKYFVPRSQFGELPVYSDVRNSGTRVLTIIRKIHGDVSELHKDLSEFLDPRTTISYTKPQTQQVVIKGDWVREVKEWLAHRGF